MRELEKIDPETQKLFDLGLSIYHVSHPDILENIIEKGSLEQKKEAIEALEWQKENQNKG
ncbi:MAG: hypothetical protein GY915_00845 [bacterium]|nr:hypothetical protein [bacterium]